MKLRDTIPVVSTSDVQATINYYCDVLGFQKHFTFGDPIVYAGVDRDGVFLYIALDSPMATLLKTNKLHPEVFLWVQDVDELYKEHKKCGAIIVEEISDRAWDARQYVIEDPNGYRLKFAEPIDEIA